MIEHDQVVMDELSSRLVSSVLSPLVVVVVGSVLSPILESSHRGAGRESDITCSIAGPRQTTPPAAGSLCVLGLQTRPSARSFFHQSNNQSKIHVRCLQIKCDPYPSPRPLPFSVPFMWNHQSPSIREDCPARSDQQPARF